jgi:hypothetical protein
VAGGGIAVAGKPLVKSHAGEKHDDPPDDERDCESLIPGESIYLEHLNLPVQLTDLALLLTA